jgi:hypothetical protein
MKPGASSLIPGLSLGVTAIDYNMITDGFQELR